MFGNSHSRDNYGSIEGATNDENADKRQVGKDGKGLSSLAGNLVGVRRNILGDKSNVVIVKININSERIMALDGQRSWTKSSDKHPTIDLFDAIPSRNNYIGVANETCIIPDGSMKDTEKENIAPNFNQAVPNTLNPTTPARTIRDWDDLDAEDSEDPLMVSEYVSEIFSYMQQLETNIIPPADYMGTQKELDWHSRSVLIDWLIEVQWKLKLLPETLFLTVNIIDRFLSKRSVSLVKLQLVGMAATLLASKYEEVLSPSIANFVYLSDNAYDEQELLKAERYMLHVLNFSLAYPSPLVFLRRISKAEDYDVRSRTLAKYLMEVCLLDHLFVSCPPSMIAAVSIYLAREMLRSGPWTPNLRHYSGDYADNDIKPWVERLLGFLKKPITYEAVFKKYALKKLMKASLFVQEYLKRMYNIPLHTIRDNGKSVFTA